MVTDKATQEAIRYTDDVDLITRVIGYPQWTDFQERLKSRGFSVNLEDDVICRMRLGELKVDFMPDDESILGFSNFWYADALESADDVALSDGIVIRVISPCFFIATKLEAYSGRGNNDPLSSHDIEDLLNVVDGRKELACEVEQAQASLKNYIAEQLSELLKLSDFEYAIQAAARNNAQREVIIFERLEGLAALKHQ